MKLSNDERTSLAVILLEKIAIHGSFTENTGHAIKSCIDDLFGPEEEGDKPKAAISELDLRASFTEDQINCLCCGKSFMMLKGHLSAEHDLTPEDYIKKFGLPPDYPMVSKNCSARRSSIAKEFGLGRNNNPNK